VSSAVGGRSRSSSGPGLREVPLDAILAEGNVRHFWSGDDAAKGLVDSVRALGVVEPVILVPLAQRVNGHRYRLLAGFRRYAASCEAGKETIPAVIREGLTEVQALELQLTENLQRLDMNPIEEARALALYKEASKLDAEGIGRRLGRSAAWVRGRLAFLDLPEMVQDRIADGTLSGAHATELARVDGLSAKLLLESLEESRRLPFVAWKERLLRRAAGHHAPSGPHGRDLCTCACSCCVNHRVPGPHPGSGFE
jgi:ParB family chromosome partitioning protein